MIIIISYIVPHFYLRYSKMFGKCRPMTLHVSMTLVRSLDMY